MVKRVGLLFVGALIAAGWSIAYLDRTIAAAQNRTVVNQIAPVEPASPTALRVASQGFTRAAADITWLTTIQYFGGGNPNERYSALAPLIRTVVTLDPDFEYPYLFGGIVLPWQNDTAAALQLLDEGQERFPRSALLPYYAGAIARLQLHDNQRAAAYFKRAALLPDAPPAAALLAGVSLTESDNRAVALAWWQSVAESSDNELVRERAIAWRDHLTMLLELERLARQETAAGRPVKDLNDLVSRGLITSLPTSPLGLSWHWDESNQTVRAQN